MYGLGTLLNVAAIVAGGLLGLCAGRFFKPSWQTGLTRVMGLCCVFVAVGGFLEASVTVTPEGGVALGGMMPAILSFALGTLLGEMADIQARVEAVGEALRRKASRAEDARFVDAFVTASLTVSVGAMAVIGALDDALKADITVLTVKSLMDFVIVAVMASAMGKGAVFSALSVLAVQGTVTLFAFAIAPVMTPEALKFVAITGSMMIFCIGVNLFSPGTFRVANMLPALVFAVLFSYF